jgi:hypothetical protein
MSYYEQLMKYYVFVCVAIVTFLVLHFIYASMFYHENSYTVTVPKECVLNEVVARQPYIFDCPR